MDAVSEIHAALDELDASRKCTEGKPSPVPKRLAGSELYTPASIAHNLSGQLKNVNRLIESGHMTQGGSCVVPRPVIWVGADPYMCRVSTTRPAGSRVQRVHLVRHGEGFHNLLSDLFNAVGATKPAQIPQMRDPPLTERGREQARVLEGTGLDATLVVCSPMHRAIQTAQIGFGALRWKANWVVRHEVREKHHGGDWDGVRDTALSAREFDWIDWSSAPAADPLPLGEMEPNENVRERGEKFLRWLSTRPEKEIVIATHSAFLFNFLNLCVECEAGIGAGSVCFDASCEATKDVQCPWFMPGECKSLWFEYVPAQIV